jgi:putative tryptophan/tyrosine transport system substrate-binding protein
MNRSKQAGMARKTIIIVSLVLLALGSFSPAYAQQPKKVPRIGVLVGPSSSFFSARIDAFREGLHDLGYVEGKNIAIEYRYAEGREDRFPDLAAQLVRLGVVVMVTTGTPATHAAKAATSTIPIVMSAIGDPVGAGLVTSLARPGGNITGLAIFSPELSGKRLELLKESFPRISRVAILWNPLNASASLSLKETQAASQALGLVLQLLEVRNPTDFGGAFELAIRGGDDALLPINDALVNAHYKEILEFAGKNRLPAIYAVPEYADAGGLMSYAPNYTDHYRRTATYVDKILKGIKPADIPVEQPIKFEFIINLKAAKRIGVTIPPNVLARADKVIK